MRDCKLKNEKDTLDALVLALCRDYFRRKEAIEDHTANRRTLTEYRYLNYRIREAAAEIVGDVLAPVYIREIGESIGYAKSRDEENSELTYKRYKQLVKANIARKLHLAD